MTYALHVLSLFLLQPTIDIGNMDIVRPFLQWTVQSLEFKYTTSWDVGKVYCRINDLSLMLSPYFLAFTLPS